MTLGISIKCYYSERHYAECRIIFIVMLNVLMLCVSMLNVVMLSVVSPLTLSLKHPIQNIEGKIFLRIFVNTDPVHQNFFTPAIEEHVLEINAVKQLS